MWRGRERYLWLTWRDLSINPETVNGERTHSWMACWPVGGGGEQTRRGRGLYSCLGVEGLDGAGTPLALVHIGVSQFGWEPRMKVHS